MKRNPVGVAITDQATTVVCSDGSVWVFEGGDWVEVKPIPGSPRAEEIRMAAVSRSKES